MRSAFPSHISACNANTHPCENTAPAPAQTPFSWQQMKFWKSRENPCSHSLVPLKLSWSTQWAQGYSPRASLSPAEQEQREVSALSLHPGPVRVMHCALATTTTTRPHLPVAWAQEMTGCDGNRPRSSLKPP